MFEIAMEEVRCRFWVLDCGTDFEAAMLRRIMASNVSPFDFDDAAAADDNCAKTEDVGNSLFKN